MYRLDGSQAKLESFANPVVIRLFYSQKTFSPVDAAEPERSSAARLFLFPFPLPPFFNRFTAINSCLLVDRVPRLLESHHAIVGVPATIFTVSSNALGVFSVCHGIEGIGQEPGLDESSRCFPEVEWTRNLHLFHALVFALAGKMFRCQFSRS